MFDTAVNFKQFVTINNFSVARFSHRENAPHVEPIGKLRQSILMKFRLFSLISSLLSLGEIKKRKLSEQVRLIKQFRAF